MVQTTVSPSLACFFMSFIILSEVNESSPLVGSSKNIKEGSVIISKPIDTLLRSPPDNPLKKIEPIIVFCEFYNPSLESNISTLSSIVLSSPTYLNLAAKVKHSFGVIVDIRMSSCWTKAP
jgi:hypothetical protein